MENKTSPRACPECGKDVVIGWHPCGALFWCECLNCWYHGPTADSPFEAMTAHDLFFDRLEKWRKPRESNCPNAERDAALARVAELEAENARLHGELFVATYKGRKA